MARKAKISHHLRHANANARAGRAIEIFNQTVDALEDVALDHEAHADELAQEIMALKTLHAKAVADAGSAQEVASKIRSLIS